MNMNLIDTDCKNTDKYGSEPNTETFENIEITPMKIDSKSVEVLDNLNNNRDEKMTKEKFIKAEKRGKRR